MEILKRYLTILEKNIKAYFTITKNNPISQPRRQLRAKTSIFFNFEVFFFFTFMFCIIVTYHEINRFYFFINNI